MLQWKWRCRYLFKLEFLFPLAIYPKVELLNHMIVLFLIFEGISILFSKNHCTNLHPCPQQYTRVPFSPHACPHISYHFDNSHLTDVRSLWFWLTFPWWLRMLSISSCICWPYLCNSSEKFLTKSSVLFLIGLFVFWYWAAWVVCSIWSLSWSKSV